MEKRFERAFSASEMYRASSSTSAHSPIKYERDNLVIRSVQDDFKTLLLNQIPQLFTPIKMELCH